MSSAMDVDGAPEAGVEEAKGEIAASGTSPSSAPTVEKQAGNKGQKGEGDRNVKLHPVCHLQHCAVSCVCARVRTGGGSATVLFYMLSTWKSPLLQVLSEINCNKPLKPVTF